MVGSRGAPLDETAIVPSWAEFQRQFWAGDVKLENGETQTLYGRVHLKQLLQNVQQERFAEALRIVSQRDTSKQGSPIAISAERG